MNSKIAIAAFVAFAFLTGNAQAITISNEDEATHQVKVVVGQGSGGEDVIIEMEAGDVTDELCEEGCTLSLSNGAELAVTGSEQVVIKDGDFGIAE